MSDLLHIEVSPLGDHSISRSVTKEFLATYNEKNPSAVIVNKDLAANPIPHLDIEAISAGYTPEADRPATMTAKYNARLALIQEIKDAKHIVISTPMWNWAVPSVLKAWIDNVLIPGVLDGAKPESSTSAKFTFIVSQGGSYAAGAPRAGWDYETGYLKQVAGAMGSKDIELILVEFGLAGIAPGMEAFVDQKNASIAAAVAAAKTRAAA
jgi:FMN-dependent NADH-azoreductase